MRDGLADRLLHGEAVDFDGAELPASLIRDLLTDELDQRGLRISGARVSGQVDLSDIVVSRPLVLRDCRVDEPVLLDRARLTSLDLSGLVAPAVSAPWLKLDHYLLMKNARLAVEGDDWALDLGEASIGSHVSLSGSHLRSERSYTVHAVKLRTGSHVYLGDVRASGTVRFDGARLGGNLDCRGAHLHSERDSALLGVDMQVDDSVFLSGGFRATTGSDRYAAVRIRGARIGGQLVLRGGEFAGAVALDVKQVRAGMEVLFPPDCLDGQVELDGLTYAGPPRDATVDEWLDMLARRTPVYASQPYGQLAAACQAAGNERDVRRIRVAQQRDLLRRGRLTRWGRVWHRITGATVGYGYRPAVALLWLLGTLAVAVGLVAGVAGPAGLVRSCSTVDQIGHALNAVTPLAKPEGVRCQVVTSSGLGQAVVISTWLLQMLAWAFATLFVAGFTGLVRKTS
ncbi:hypothetical protein ALI22I_12970 [Saccharothrix sp. ALI-22-I]|uniref:hypothetical protein n=1 Tax=Saccharothrix sp. ALI-22-I TaxID=1933778 RepID=UPI00097CA806|nr:hypothetical protein [Saccharothrix sp. ALI-22-I]ONI90229.1 hypothetical protein ALI22I_12970 [Saccharothrix sp. ALI-22-I]